MITWAWLSQETHVAIVVLNRRFSTLIFDFLFPFLGTRLTFGHDMHAKEKLILFPF